jgi:hypothetical protein
MRDDAGAPDDVPVRVDIDPHADGGIGVGGYIRGCSPFLRDTRYPILVVEERFVKAGATAFRPPSGLPGRPPRSQSLFFQG